MVLRIGTVVFLTLLNFSAVAQILAKDSKTYTSEGMKFKVETLTDTNGVIWGFDFLPNGDVLLSQREGKLLLFDMRTGESAPITGLPSVAARGQGGLLDVRVHPDFKNNGWIYLSYSEPVEGKMTTALGRGKLIGTKLENFTRLFSAHEPNSNLIHFGSRIEFSGPYVFLSIGDRNERENVQSLAFHTGKVLRLTADGKPAKGNPFEKTAGAKPEIWSYGHRNPQGLARHPVTGDIWEAEMGPRGGDEVNLLKGGANYGWPLVTFGREYSGEVIGETSKPGMEAPVAYWVPSISPSAIAFYNGDVFPKWKGHLFLGNLSGMHLRRLSVQGDAVTSQEELLKDLSERFRNVREGLDGALYFSTDSGRFARLIPADGEFAKRFIAPGARQPSKVK